MVRNITRNTKIDNLSYDSDHHHDFNCNPKFIITDELMNNYHHAHKQPKLPTSMLLLLLFIFLYTIYLIFFYR